jgi:hypothetical protein
MSLFLLLQRRKWAEERREEGRRRQLKRSTEREIKDKLYMTRNTKETEVREADYNEAEAFFLMFWRPLYHKDGGDIFNLKAGIHI